MHHLRGLCDVLETTLDEMTKDEPGEAVTAAESALLIGIRKLTPEQTESILALVQAMKPKVIGNGG